MNLKKYCTAYFTDIIFKYYFKFDGREGRKVFLLFLLNQFIVNSILASISGGFLSLIFSLLILLPFLGLTVRRLHDINFNGWWVLLCFIPVIGVIALIVFGCIPGTEGENKYGPAVVDVVEDKVERSTTEK